MRLPLLLAVFAVCASCNDSSGPDTGTGTGTLVVEIAGLPVGTAGAVHVTGPGGFDESVTATKTFIAVAPGSYSLTTTPVTVGGTTYSSSAQVNFTVSAGSLTSVTVTYFAFSLDLQLVVEGLTAPVYLTAPAGDPRLFIVEQPGRIRVFKNGALLPTPFLDITSRVLYGGEQGLLSVAFDPSYATNGFFYVYFVNSQGNIAIERFTSPPGSDVATATSATPVLGIAHPTNANHNGGLLMFGPDGMLYAGTGDGGSAGDPPGNAQNVNSLLGKLLRLDVRTLPYTPAGTTGEIWALGLRNPWRFDFNVRPGSPSHTDLYIADVGQGAWEEIDVSPDNPGGLNYGWNKMEGDACYPPGSNCSTAGLTRPALAYSHAEGCSITGGFVYRGTAIPEITGDYFFSDYCTGFLNALRGDPASGFTRIRWTIPNIGNVLSFGEDAAGEQYMLTSAGRVYRIVAKRP